jgi:transposase
LNRTGFTGDFWLESRCHGLLFQHCIIAFLGFGRRDVADGLQQSAIVEPVDPGQRRELDSLEAALWPMPVYDLGFVAGLRIFDRSSEKMSSDQLSLLDTAAPAPVDPGTAEPSGEDAIRQRRRGGGGRRPLPDNLPRVIREILPASAQCRCCSQLHLVPAHAGVYVTVRPKFACRACGVLAQTPAPDDRPIERGLPTAGTIAKYLNHMPLHRQAAHYARLGVLLATTTLYGWVEAAARDLAPIADRLLELLVRRSKIHADDTPVAVLNPGRSGTHDGRFRVYADDTRPRGGSEPSIAVFRFSAGRAGKHPAQHLAGFTGTVQPDAFSGFDHLYRGGTMVEAGCLAHARRKLVDLVRAKGPPVAAEGVKQIAALYRIERRIYGLPPVEHLSVRQSEAVPLLNALRMAVSSPSARAWMMAGSGLAPKMRIRSRLMAVPKDVNRMPLYPHRNQRAAHDWHQRCCSMLDVPDASHQISDDIIDISFSAFLEIASRAQYLNVGCLISSSKRPRNNVVDVVLALVEKERVLADRTSPILSICQMSNHLSRPKPISSYRLNFIQ